MIIIVDKNIKKVAEEFRKKNGNERINNTDLLIYIMSKVDNLPCVPHVEKIARVETRQKMTMWGIGIGLSVIGLLYVLF